MNKPQNAETIFVRDLNANDLFLLPGLATVYRVESRQTMGANTRVTYVVGNGERFTFVKPNLSTAYLLGA